MPPRGTLLLEEFAIVLAATLRFLSPGLRRMVTRR
jgi:hypothetical protein